MNMIITALQIKSCEREARAEILHYNDLKAGQFKHILSLIFFLIPSENDDNLPKNINMRARSASGNFFYIGTRRRDFYKQCLVLFIFSQILVNILYIITPYKLNLASAERERKFCHKMTRKQGISSTFVWLQFLF